MEMKDLKSLSDLFVEHDLAVGGLSSTFRQYGELVGNEKIEEAGRMIHSRQDWYTQFRRGVDLKNPTKHGQKGAFRRLLHLFEFYVKRVDIVLKQLEVFDPFGWAFYSYDGKKLDTLIIQVSIHREIQRLGRLEKLLAEKLQELQNQ